MFKDTKPKVTDELDFAIWPQKYTNPLTVLIERDLRKRLKEMDLYLIADRTAFTDPHFMGGYAICKDDRFIAGKDFDLTLIDAEFWLAEAEQKRQEKLGTLVSA